MPTNYKPFNIMFRPHSKVSTNISSVQLINQALCDIPVLDIHKKQEVRKWDKQF